MKRFLFLSGIICFILANILKSQTLNFEDPLAYKLISKGLNSPAVTIANPVKTAENNSDSVVIYDKPGDNITVWSSALQVILLPEFPRKFNNLVTFKAYLNHPTSCFVRTGTDKYYEASNYTDAWITDSIGPKPYLITDTNKWITLYFILDTFTVHNIDTLVIEFHNISLPDKPITTYIDDITLSSGPVFSNVNYEPLVTANIKKWNNVITPDGELNEDVYKDTLAFINNQRYLSIGTVVDNNDNSGMAYASWNDTALMIGVNVKDNEIDEKPDEGGYLSDGFLYDRIEIFIDPYSRFRNGHLKSYQWQMRFNPRMINDTFLTMMIYQDTAMYFDNPVQKYISSYLVNEGNTYTLETVIPFWTLWCGFGVSIASAKDSAAKYVKTGYKLGFDLTINDVDEANNKSNSHWSVLNWSNGTNNLNYNTSKYYGQLVLTEKVLHVKIKQQPANNYACKYTDANFSIDAINAKTFQWFVSSNDGANWYTIVNDTTFTGATSANLIVKNVYTSLDRFKFKCVVSDSIFFLTSDTVTLFVEPIQRIVTQPSDTVIDMNDGASFTVVTEGNFLSYYWQADKGSGFANITGGTGFSGYYTGTLQIASITNSIYGYKYRCVIYGSCLSSPLITAEVRANVIDGTGTLVSDLPGMSIYPNPCKNYINLTYKLDESGIVKIELYNILGLKLSTLLSARESTGFYKHHIDIDKLMLADGLYYLRININDKQVVGKFSVRR